MLVLRLRPLAFATFLVWRLRIGACGVGAYDSYPTPMWYLIGIVSQVRQISDLVSNTKQVDTFFKKIFFKLGCLFVRGKVLKLDEKLNGRFRQSRGDDVTGAQLGRGHRNNTWLNLKLFATVDNETRALGILTHCQTNQKNPTIFGTKSDIEFFDISFSSQHESSVKKPLSFFMRKSFLCVLRRKGEEKFARRKNKKKSFTLCWGKVKWFRKFFLTQTQDHLNLLINFLQDNGTMFGS